MKLTEYIHLIIITVLIVSCQKPEENSMESGLSGTWEWVRTDGGIAHHIHDTPASTGQQIKWVFTRDGVYYKYVNATLNSKGRYTLEMRDCIHSAGQKRMINFSSELDPDRMIESLEEGVLVVSDENYDGMESEFIRKNEEE